MSLELNKTNDCSIECVTITKLEIQLRLTQERLSLSRRSCEKKDRTIEEKECDSSRFTKPKMKLCQSNVHKSIVDLKNDLPIENHDLTIKRLQRTLMGCKNILAGTDSTELPDQAKTLELSKAELENLKRKYKDQASYVLRMEAEVTGLKQTIKLIRPLTPSPTKSQDQTEALELSKTKLKNTEQKCQKQENHIVKIEPEMAASELRLKSHAMTIELLANQLADSVGDHKNVQDLASDEMDAMNLLNDKLGLLINDKDKIIKALQERLKHIDEIGKNQINRQRSKSVSEKSPTISDGN